MFRAGCSSAASSASLGVLEKSEISGREHQWYSKILVIPVFPWEPCVFPILIYFSTGLVYHFEYWKFGIWYFTLSQYFDTP